MGIQKVKLKVPATSANLGPGFDTLGIALNLYNEIEVIKKTNKQRSLRIFVEGEGKDILTEGKNNVVYKSMERIFNLFNMKKDEIDIRLFNNIPLSRGLGSSAAARVGGLVAANIICGNKLKQEELISIATELEGHPDNVVPAFVGGLCVACINGGKVEFVKLAPPSYIKFIICIPEFEVSTENARKILPVNIDFHDAVFNVQRASLLLAALMNKRYDLLSAATEDKLHQPYRKNLIPGFDDVFRVAKENNALGVYLSGSGPSIAVISDNDNKKNEMIGEKICGVFKKRKIHSRYKILSPDSKGLVINK